MNENNKKRITVAENKLIVIRWEREESGGKTKAGN